MHAAASARRKIWEVILIVNNSQFDETAIRRRILTMAYNGSTAHIGPAFSLVEILCELYENFARYPENDPDSDDRDFLVLSKGHGVMAQYACLFEKGWITQAQLDNYFADDSDLHGLSDSHITGLEVTSGSLGHGFSVGVGMALGVKRRSTDQRVYVVIGDGEANEGTIWEAALFAAQHKLNNVIVIADNNGLQAMGHTAEILSVDDLETKFASFGFDTWRVNGHDRLEIREALTDCLSSTNDRPKFILADTVKGFGVSFMQGDNAWHYQRLNEDTFAKALAELGPAQ